jgi:gamma-glutamyltranspeptidase/glutathione hydrolase
LQARFEYIQQHRLTLPFKYACPSGVLRSGNTNWGATEISSPWADAVGE